MLDDFRPRCVDCRTEGPPSKGDVMLLSRLGWRLVRRMDPHGQVISEWRCPTCADRFKKLRALAGMASGFHRPVEGKKAGH